MDGEMAAYQKIKGNCMMWVIIASMSPTNRDTWDKMIPSITIMNTQKLGSERAYSLPRKGMHNHLG